MKKIYWRPQKISTKVLILIFIVSLSSYLAVQKFQIRKNKPNYKEKIAAAKLAENAFDLIRAERLRRGIPIDSEADPAETGLIGLLSSPITTNSGYLPAKRSSVNPNFAAVVLQYLKNLDVKKDDIVAVGVSGSFPAMNIAVYAAIESIGAKAIVISSAGSSQWGANFPNFTWPDMENFLFKSKIFQIKSVGVTLGGIDDRALGIPAEGRKMLEESILANGYNFIKVKNYPDSVEKKIQLFKEMAGEKPIKAYINVGGGTSSVGTKLGKYKFQAGINTRIPPGVAGVDSVMVRFVQEGIPVIHLTKVEELTVKYGFPEQPKTMPLVGEGKIYATEEPNRKLAVATLLIILATIYALVRLDWGFRLLNSPQSSKSDHSPQQMI